MPPHAGGVTAAAGSATQRTRGGARSAPPPHAARRRPPWGAVTVAAVADIADCFSGSQHCWRHISIETQSCSGACECWCGRSTTGCMHVSAGVDDQ
eukprot:363401-Chlamydomonas_euryale.AAC.5